MTEQDEEHTVETDLLSAAALQDSLLQSYRGFQLTLQSILIAVGTGLSVALYSFDDQTSIIVFASVQVILTFIGVFALLSLRNIILARGRDVNFWHRAIIRNEFKLPPARRPFTEFKVHQQLRRSRQGHVQNILSMAEVSDEKADEVANSLVSGGLGHTRRRIDNWFSWSLLSLWATLLCVSGGRVIMILAN